MSDCVLVISSLDRQDSNIPAPWVLQHPPTTCRLSWRPTCPSSSLLEREPTSPAWAFVSSLAPWASSGFSDNASFRWVPPWGQWRYFCYQWGTTVGQWWCFCYQWGTTVGSVVVPLLLGCRRGVSGGALLWEHCREVSGSAPGHLVLWCRQSGSVVPLVLQDPRGGLGSS